MSPRSTYRSRQSGTVLFYVASLLLITSFLFALVRAEKYADYRINRHLQGRYSDIATTTALLDFALDWIMINGQPESLARLTHLSPSRNVIEFVDVAAFVDLNSSSTNLLRDLLLGIGLSESEATEITIERDDLRKNRYTFESVEHFISHFSMRSRSASQLRQFATTFSGRRGIAASDSPLALIQALCSCDASIGFETVSSKYGDRPNGRTFRVNYYHISGPVALGTIVAGRSREHSRILMIFLP